MDLDLVFLGTSGSVPTAKRGLAGTLLRRGGERILVDCGEGTQRQLLRSSVGLVELPEIFLTHYHADHYLGLPGMLKTFALRGREVPLTVYGPPGLNDLFGILRRVFGRLSYELDPRRAATGRERRARATIGSKRSPSSTASSANGYALVEEPRPGRFDLEDGEASRRTGRTALRTPAGRRAGRAPGRNRGETRAGARSRAAREEGRPCRRYARSRLRPRGIEGRGRPRPRSDVLGRGAGARRRDAARHRDERGRARASQPECACSPSPTCRTATSGRRSCARRAPSSSRRSCRRTSISSTSASRSGAGPGS